MKTFIVSLALLLGAATAHAALPVSLSRTQSPITVTDVQSATITTTTLSPGSAAGAGTAYSVQVSVGVVSGSGATLDVEVQESDDNGSNWYAVYDFPRITAAGVYRSAVLPLTGGKLRYVQTVGGGSPSFNLVIKRQQENWAGQRLIRQIFDRTINLATANSVSASVFAEGSMNVELSVNLGTAGTAPALQLQGSDDGINWFLVGTPLSTTASATSTLFLSNIAVKFLRATVTTAGASVIPGYVLVKAY